MKIAVKILTIISLVGFVIALLATIGIQNSVSDKFIQEFANDLIKSGAVPSGKTATQYAKEILQLLFVFAYIGLSIGIVVSTISVICVFKNVQSKAAYITLGVISIISYSVVTGVLLIVYGAGNFFKPKKDKLPEEVAQN